MVRSPTAVVKSDIEALRRCGLTIVLMVDHNPHELTTIMVNLPQPLSDCWSGWQRIFIISLWSCCFTIAMINVPQSWSSAKSSSFHKIMQFSTLSLYWAVALLQYKTSVQTWVLPRKHTQNGTKTHKISLKKWFTQESIRLIIWNKINYTRKKGDWIVC